MRVRFDQVEQIGEELTRQSLESLTAVVGTETGDHPTGGVAVVVFNPDCTERTDILTATIELPASSSGDFVLVDEAGTSLPFETRGLGSRELVNTTVNPKEFRDMFGQVVDGRAAGMTIQDLKVQRQGTYLDILAVMNGTGEPNWTKWEKGKEEIEAFLTDQSLKTVHIRARSGSSTQLVFVAPHVPGLGYRTFWLHDKPTPPASLRMSAIVRRLMPLAAQLASSRLGSLLIGLLSPPASRGPAKRIENEFFAVDAAKDGTLSVLDKRSGATYPGLNRFVDGGDRGDEYNYAPPEADRFVAGRLKRIRSQHGSVQQTLELILELRIPLELSSDRKSRLKQRVKTQVTTRITLNASVQRVDIRTTIENSARDHRLRVHFPAPFAAEAGYHDGAFEIVRRPIGIPAFDQTWIEQPRPEVPQRAFTQVTNERLGLTIAARGLPEVEVLRNLEGNAEIALTLLRCVGWLSRDDFSTRKGHAGPKLATPEAQMPGQWTFDYSVLPHPAGSAEVIRSAYAFQTSLRAVGDLVHPGALPASACFLRVDPEEFCISAIKQAEDGHGWLVRGYNRTSVPIQVKLSPWRIFRHVELVNLAEEKVSDLERSPEGKVLFPARGHQIVTVLFRDGAIG
jgi:hypothetical protein